MALEEKKSPDNSFTSTNTTLGSLPSAKDMVRKSSIVDDNEVA